MVEMKFNAGDYVKLRLAKREIEGTVLESQDGSVLLLKLSSGYNIGILRENVLGWRVLRKFKEEEGDFELPKGEKGLPSIGLIVTGGTIASKLDAKTGGVAPLTHLGEFAKFYPELFKMANVKIIDSPFMIASESMSVEHWRKIADSTRRMLNDSSISGVVITHGTDTLHYTSAALSFFLKDLNKPVVLTYSQRSVDRASSDASLNLQCAVLMALSNCAEVVLVGHGTTNDDFCYAFRGTKVRKMHTSRRDTFKAVNDLPLARVTPDKVEFLEERRPRSKSEVILDYEFSDKVALVKFYPGQSADILDYYALKYRGVVLEGTGLGHVSEEWTMRLKKVIREGLVVCMTSQCLFGRVDGFVYSNGRALIDAGVVFLEDVLPETALVKLGWILGHHGWKGKVKEKMLENVAGELNPKLGLGFL